MAERPERRLASFSYMPGPDGIVFGIGNRRAIHYYLPHGMMKTPHKLRNRFYGWEFCLLGLRWLPKILEPQSYRLSRIADPSCEARSV